MRIGIDIDDVITDTSASIRKYIDKSEHRDIIYNYIEEVMRGEMPNEEIKKFYKDNTINIFKEAKVKENVSEIVNEWLNEHNEVFIITSRGEKRFKDSELLTLQYLKSNKINYTRIIFNLFDKAKICKENNIDVMIDDSVRYCIEIEKENIKSILYTSIVNKSINVKIPRVNNWFELKKMVDVIKKEVNKK